MKDKLYMVELFVKPTRDHPKYQEMEYGVFHCLLLDEDHESTAQRAAKIIEQLPYRVATSPAVLKHIPNPEKDRGSGWKEMVNAALQFGFSTSFSFFPKGSHCPGDVEFEADSPMG